MCSGLSWMDSEWRKTPKFIYGKVLEGSEKFRGCTEKVWIILEGVGPGQLGRPHRARHTMAGRVGGRVPPLPLHASWKGGRTLSFPLPFLGVLFPFILASWSLDWFEQET